jgi:hypothetical protein
LIETGSKVSVFLPEGKVVNPDIAEWVKANEGRTFYVVSSHPKAARLKGVTFAVSLDMLKKA